MFNKYAELRKIALLYTACRGLLRIKLAADTYDQWAQEDMNINDLKNMSQDKLEDLYTQDTSHLNPRVQNWLNNWAQQQQGGANPAPATPPPATPPAAGGATESSADKPLPPAVNGGMSSAQAMALANKRMAASGAGTAAQPNANPAQPQRGVRRVNRQQWMQMNQNNINRAGQQAGQNATKGFFGRAMNWLTGGGYKGWVQGRAQNQAQQRYNNQFDTLKNDPRKMQQYNQQRRTGQQIQQFLMNGPYKNAGYSLLNLFPGYRQLFNYV